MTTGLKAVQHIRRMRGGSQSHLLRASDGAYYVTKFQNNPQHVRVLANEMFATRLGQWLGLPMPRVEVIEVSDWLIANTPDLKVQVGKTSVPCSSGRQLASLYVASELVSFDYLPECVLQTVSNLQDFARVLILDKWTANSDGRQAVFTRKLRGRRYSATFIDQGYCFNAGEWSFDDSPLRGIYARDCVYRTITGWDAFEPALGRAEQMDISDLCRLAGEIPEEWCGESRNLDQIVEQLFRRRKRLRDLVDAFRCSNHHPFPNWTERSIHAPTGNYACAVSPHP